MTRIAKHRDRREHLEFLLLGVVGLAESLLIVLSLGFLSADWRAKFLFRDRT